MGGKIVSVLKWKLAVFRRKLVHLQTGCDPREAHYEIA
jgi:hypothetical protein